MVMTITAKAEIAGVAAREPSGYRSHCRLTTLAPSSPAGRRNSTSKQDHERDGVLVAGGDDPDAEGLDDAEREAAEDGPQRVAEPSRGGRREAL